MLTAGTRFGSYDVLSPLGAGGMGEVFRARDLKLGREVALKVLPQNVSAEPDRIARFQREAQVLASLNHPHIAAIYGLEEVDGVRALVLELVEGATLADRIARGPLPVEEALPIVRQIAEALETAHEQGIVHRDLKPANIKVDPNGRVKVLDFGLAKLTEQPASPTNSSALSMSPTITTPAMTQLGMILGTAAYMSPEQAKGRPADKRSDVWAFGCVLYEMLTGKRTFEGEDVSETLASVLKDEPRWDALPSDLPSSIRQLLRGMLQRDRSRRLSSVPPLLLEQTREAPAQRSFNRLLAIGLAAAVLVAAAAAYGFLAQRGAAPSRPVKRVLLSPGFGQSLGRPTAGDADLAMAPNGSHVAYITVPASNTPQLWLRDVQQLAPMLVKTVAAPRNPFFSPDGEWIGFFDGPTLKKVSVKGGAPIPIVSGLSLPRGGTWLDNNRIVFGTTGLKWVSADGGVVESLTDAAPGAEGSLSHRWPERLPGKNAVLFTAAQGIDQFDVAVLDLETKKWRVVLAGATNAKYVSSGHLVYGAGGRLEAIRFDLESLAIVGKPVQVKADVLIKPSGAVAVAAGDEGSLVYFDSEARPERSFYWIDAKGNSSAAAGLPAGEIVHPRISPDGSRFIYTRQNDDYDLWVYDLKRGVSEKLTSSRGIDRDAVWSPDGQRIAYYVGGATGGSGIFVMSADGAQPRRVTTGNHRPTSWSADGKQIVFAIVDGEAGSNDIAAVNADGEAKISVLLNTGAAETLPAVSPRGEWMAYRSNEAGVNAIYVRPFAGGTRRRISPDTGDQPFWGVDGTLYFRDGDRIMAVRRTSGPIETWSAPELAFEFPLSFVDLPRNIDIMPDGRFLVLREKNDDVSRRELVLVENWLSELGTSGF